MDDLDSLVEEIRKAHEARADLPEAALITKEFRPRPRPKTAIISEAAMNAEWVNET